MRTKKQKQKEENRIFISFSLIGESAEKFQRLMDARHLTINAELARSLLIPAVDAELKTLKPVKPVAA